MYKEDPKNELKREALNKLYYLTDKESGVYLIPFMQVKKSSRKCY